MMGSAMGKVRGAMGRHGRGLGGAKVQVDMQVGRLGFTEACSARVNRVTIRELGFLLFIGLGLTGYGP